MSKCCGEQRNTAYCPDCGAKIDETDLASLLRYCRSTLKVIRGSLEMARKRTEREAGSEARRKKRIAAYEKTVEKWSKWIVALEAAIKREAGE